MRIPLREVRPKRGIRWALWWVFAWLFCLAILVLGYVVGTS